VAKVAQPGCRVAGRGAIGPDGLMVQSMSAHLLLKGNYGDSRAIAPGHLGRKGASTTKTQSTCADLAQPGPTSDGALSRKFGFLGLPADVPERFVETGSNWL
jgi:hypothetical protein